MGRRLCCCPRRSVGLWKLRERVTLSGRVYEANWPTLWFLGLGLVLGRLLLSWLPPGEPGGHSRAELPRTLAASLWLGISSLWILRGLVPDGIVLGAVALLGSLRLATLPGAIVPARGKPRERAGALACGLLLVALGVALGLPWFVELGTGFPRLVLSLVGGLTVLFLDSGLGEARRAALGRRCFVLAQALLVLALCWRERKALELGGEFACALSLCGGAAYGLAWLRRGDRRCGALAALCLSSVGLWSALDGRVLGLVAAACLVLRTHANSRSWIAGWSLAGWAIALLAAFPHPRWIGLTDLLMTPVLNVMMLHVLAGLAGALALIAGVLRALRARQLAEPEEDRLLMARGNWFLLLLLAGTGATSSVFLAALIQASSLEQRSWWPGAQLVAFAPLAFLLAGCLSVRPERAA